MGGNVESVVPSHKLKIVCLVKDEGSSVMKAAEPDRRIFYDKAVKKVKDLFNDKAHLSELIRTYKCNLPNQDFELTSSVTLCVPFVILHLQASVTFANLHRYTHQLHLHYLCVVSLSGRHILLFTSTIFQTSCIQFLSSKKIAC